MNAKLDILHFEFLHWMSQFVQYNIECGKDQFANVSICQLCFSNGEKNV